MDEPTAHIDAPSSVRSDAAPVAPVTPVRPDTGAAPTVFGVVAPEGVIGRLALVAPSLLVFAAVQLVVVTALAMLAYDGGTEATPSVGAYSFSHNFLSDLGALTGYNGQSQALLDFLFTYGLVCTGLALIVFGLPMPRLRTGGKGRLAAALAPIAVAISIGWQAVGVRRRLRQTG
jgi:hypothetical protein